MVEDATKDGTEETPQEETPVETPKVGGDIDTTEDNMAELRKAKEVAEKATKQAEKDAKAAEAKASESIAERDRKDALKEIVGDDEEMGRKVTEEYKVLNMPDGTPEEIKARMEKAHKLAQPTPEKMSHEAVSSGSASATPRKTDDGADPEFQDKMGVDQDKAKSLSADVEAMRLRRRNG